jgi:hypothetical protein
VGRGGASGAAEGTWTVGAAAGAAGQFKVGWRAGNAGIGAQTAATGGEFGAVEPLVIDRVGHLGSRGTMTLGTTATPATATPQRAVSTWVTRSTNDNGWQSIAWAPELGLFAAVALSGSSGNRVMTSSDGITWVTRASAADNQWRDIAWSSELGLFAAVAQTGSGNRVMTSSDGITWVTRASAADINWRGIAWAAELGLFAAVADSGSGNRVMTSSDGITWVTRASAADNGWIGIAWSSELGLFAAVARTGSGNRVMTSSDGITWVTRASAADNEWRGIAWSSELGLFAAVANTGSGNRVMTSSDGITWVTRASAADNGWLGIAWSSELGLFVAVANTGSGNRVMTSSDGITWVTRASAADNEWFGIAWSPQLYRFAAVSTSGTGNRVMTSIIPAEVQPVIAVNDLGRSVLVTASHFSIGQHSSGVAGVLRVYNNLADISGSVSSLLGLQTQTSGNRSRLEFREVRNDSGSSWNGTQTEILRRIDGVETSKIIFGPTAGHDVGLAFCTGFGSLERVRISNSGSVGIGTTNPAQALEVSGNILASGTITPSSDDRVKFDEVSITSAVPTLLKLRPQIYRKAGALNLAPEDVSGAPLESGLIAQEVFYDAPELRHLVIVPEDASGVEVPPADYPSSDPAVDPDYSNWGSTPAALNYIGLVPYLVRAVQEQQAEINALKAQLQGGSA